MGALAGSHRVPKIEGLVRHGLIVVECDVSNCWSMGTWATVYDDYSQL